MRSVYDVIRRPIISEKAIPKIAGNQGQTGALYCSSDTSLGLVATSDKVDSPQGTPAEWGLNSGTDTLLLWFKGTAATAGTLAGFETTGAGGASDRVLWMDASGNVAPKRVIRSGPIDAPSPMLSNAHTVAYDTKRNQILVPN